MASRVQRFTSDGNDIVTSNVQVSLKILQAVEMHGASDLQLFAGLQNEIKTNINLAADWSDAVQWFKSATKFGDWAKNETYHLALRTFSLNRFYGEFNEACRNLKSENEAKWFKFRHYFNLLLRAVRNVRGDPEVVHYSTKLYRGCRIQFPNLFVNEKFLFKQFTSTSLVKSITDNFFGLNGTLFVIEGINHGTIGNQSVIGLKRHSAIPSESEVLISPFQVFKIIKIDRGAHSITTVHLQVSF